MPLNPIAHDRGKLADLQIETAIIPRRETKRIFIKTDFSATSTRVEPAIESLLSKEINLGPDLRVVKESQARIEEIVDLAVDEPRRRLLEMIHFKINSAAQSSPKNIVKRRESERGIESL